MLTVAPARSPFAPLAAAVLLLLVAESPRPADSAPLTLYGVQLPDPLHVYTLQEAKPENIRNDPFLVVFKTHIPSLRPYEIPYFPPKDRYAADEQEENSLPNSTTNPEPPQEQTTVESSQKPAKDEESDTSGTTKVNPDDKLDMEKLPELVELKPEALLEALDASKQDAEEGQTARPGEAAQLLFDKASDGGKLSPEKETSGDEKEVDSSKQEEEKENDIPNRDDVLKDSSVKENESQKETPSKVDNKDEIKNEEEQEDDKNTDSELEVEPSDRVEKDEDTKQKVQ